MPIDSGNLALKGLDELFSTEEKRQEEQREQVQQIPIDELHPFTNHPFKVVDDEAMTRTVESIAQFGVLAPLIARPRPDGDGYEIISGHRRQFAAKMAGLETLPVIVRDMDDDAATILMVDSNLQREHISPSERAFAYKMKMDAMKRTAGRPPKENPRQVVGNFETADLIGKESGESGRQVQRFIRLTNLIPELLDMVDEKKVSFNPAVELSYLSHEQQQEVINAIDSNNVSDNDFAPFLNIMNEWYAKDTSNKIKAVFDARMKDGKRCSGSIPYGYNRLPNDKQTLVVDPVASEVVKRIFLLANEGKSPRAIAERLTEEKVLIPAAYAQKYHPEQYNGIKFSDPYLWGTSSVRTILGRQEYLGHTVLRKSVSTNFKLHKRKETDEDEQYVFQNTHEPIISQELWDSVQKRRYRVNRASAWGTHTNRLSGYLYCADCGRRLTLQTHYSKKDGSTQYSYRCGGYASRVNGCTAHSISADNVEALILASVKRFSRFVLKDEETFALELQSIWKEKREEKPKQNQSELKRCQKRYDELSALIRSLYENLMSGLLPERQYKQLMTQYDSEQAELESKMETMKSEIAEDKSSSADIQHFISLIRKCKNPTEISDSMLNELVDKIVVYEAEGTGNARTQKVDIYFNYVGQVDIAYTEEELAELKAQKEQEERQRMEKQRKREKAYREKRKAKKIAENGGEIIKTKTCPHCGKVFTPTSNRQIFCSRDCWNQSRQEQKKADREAERGNHYYRQRACAVCGHSYWPTHSQQEFCSDECRRIDHNKKTLEFYHKKKGNPKPDPEAAPTPNPKEDNAA